MLTTDPQRALIIERDDRRVLGAVRFVDATSKEWVVAPLDVRAANARFLRNHSGTYVIVTAAGLESHLTAVDLRLPDVDPVTVDIDVEDPSGRYLARRVRVTVPRDPDPANGGTAGSLFRAVAVPLYAAPSAPTFPGWAVVRASVKQGATDVGVPHAWLRLRRVSPAAAPPLATALADSRGEALVAVSGIPVTNWDAESGPVLATEIDAILEAYGDVGASSPPDPDVIDNRRATLPVASVEVKLAPGRQIVARLALTLA